LDPFEFEASVSEQEK